MKTELDSAWESAIHNAERARKAEAEIERLQAELAEAKKFKDGMLDVLGGACPNDHRSTPFEEFKGCTPCLRAELAEARRDAERRATQLSGAMDKVNLYERFAMRVIRDLEPFAQANPKMQSLWQRAKNLAAKGSARGAVCS